MVVAVLRLIRGDIPLDGASFDWDVLKTKWSCKFVFRFVNGVDGDVSMNGWDWDVGEFCWCVGLRDDDDDWAPVIDDNFGKLKHVRRIRWRELDFDGRTIPGLDSSAKN